MQFHMRFGGFARVMLGLLMVSMGEMRVMGARLVIVLLEMGGGLTMMLGGAFEMLGGVLMMFGGALGVTHDLPPLWPQLAESFL
jgi:hypothetical protein